MSNLIPIIEKAVSSGVDPDNLQKMLDMQLTILATEAKQAYAASMTKCQAELPLIVKNAENKQTNSNYAKHELICKEIKPVYTKHGFSLSFGEAESTKEKHIRTVCKITHELGHSEEDYIDLPLDDSGLKGTVNKTGVHATGSTFSYARRYLTLMVFDLATYDDNDAAMANVISNELALKLEEMITKNNLNMDAIMAYILSICGAESLNLIPENYYGRIFIAIQRKIKEVKGSANDNNKA